MHDPAYMAAHLQHAILHLQLRDGGSWEVSDKLWVFWVTTPSTASAALVVWRSWLAVADAIPKYPGGHGEMAGSTVNSEKQGNSENRSPLAARGEQA
jgi:hypothetical protein